MLNFFSSLREGVLSSFQKEIVELMLISRLNKANLLDLIDTVILLDLCNILGLLTSSSRNYP